MSIIRRLCIITDNLASLSSRAALEEAQRNARVDDIENVLRNVQHEGRWK